MPEHNMPAGGPLASHRGGRKAVVVVVVVIEFIVAHWILSRPKLPRFSDYDNDNDDDVALKAFSNGNAL